MSRQTLNIPSFTNETGNPLGDIKLNYRVFGCPIGTAPVVVAIHALTGNADVAGTDGWWSESFGDGKPVDTKRYCVIAFDLPGNIYDTFNKFEVLEQLMARDVAKLFVLALEQLNIPKVYAATGVSMGGGIVWEMAALAPSLIEYLIPVVSHWRATNWIIGNCKIQDQILRNSNNPVHDARMMAMFSFRTPRAINAKFDYGIDEKTGLFNVESWLLHHGKKLVERFSLEAYLLMNNYVRTIDVTRGRGTFKEVAQTMQCSKIVMIAIDRDLYFLPDDNKTTAEELQAIGKETHYHELTSIDGHDGFFIETEQVNEVLKQYF